MKPEQAIEILRKDIDNPGSVAIEDVNEAEEIGIGAIDIVINERIFYLMLMNCYQGKQKVKKRSCHNENTRF